MKEYIQTNLIPKVNKIAANKYLKAVSDGFMTIMPVIIVGAIFSLFNSLSIPAYQEFITNTGLKSILTIPNMVTNDMLAVYAVFFIAFSLAKQFDKDAGVAGMISLFTFLAITPISNTSGIINNFLKANKVVLPDGVKAPAANVFTFDYLGAKGLFVAIIVALISTVIYNKLIDSGLAIKMPKGVPPTITKSFLGLIPGFVIIILFMLLNKATTLLPIQGIDGLHSLIYTLIQKPLEAFIGNNIFSFLFAILLAQILWFFGVHGVSAVILPIFYPLWTSLTAANIEAMNAGVSLYELPNIINRSFFSVYALCGGSGATLGLCIYMALRAKSKQYKTLGKLAVLSNICGINEPIVFATPMVLNPYMAIPWICTPLIASVIGYILTYIKVVPRLTTIVPLGTPVLMSGFLAGGVDGWRVALVQVLIIALSALIYLPFFSVIDKKSYLNELEAENSEK
ncbi:MULTISPECIES: PTS sugar transporter subunit IIC [Clostridium]|jgi:PTS system cellobiose-specific IIC component|uniref:Permease IIC component n=1 Tax=Clostridium saccharoperbutylacetonicum N1-4(HMT) TaxID=931276 RepID=M1N5H0_9CLOT|nr:MULTISPECIES: PTS transporter subunit EIIC [Clostridium]AGF58667.1 PTS system, lactose/cellobiose family IIC component [Clostridium saccharoperbutylacetonicum N1-4(HMT)]AQR97358.1 lichenan permease IIC component [Clostridium saccharoperbutylacetonicum]NRT60554.1 PTS system cellobiose-specific IIC component [Clostridium saccharoperbutylacetonicum]NSB23868.1 PTS system cellobiose-specific IIC component [Clostridium saccharoperbutylacetonicum]NSB33241.1 PTS system cellobiose-specific IIC compo